MKISKEKRSCHGSFSVATVSLRSPHLHLLRLMMAIAACGGRVLVAVLAAGLRLLADLEAAGPKCHLPELLQVLVVLAGVVL